MKSYQYFGLCITSQVMELWNCLILRSVNFMVTDFGWVCQSIDRLIYDIQRLSNFVGIKVRIIGLIVHEIVPQIGKLYFSSKFKIEECESIQGVVVAKDRSGLRIRTSV